MKRITAFLLCLLLTLASFLHGCAEAPADKPDNLLNDFFTNEVNLIRVNRRRGGDTKTLYAEYGDIESLKKWAAGLKFEPRSFESGSAPGGTDGNESYEFIFGDRSFSYLSSGENDSWLFIGGSWYKVLNPTAPPDQSFFSDPSLDESVTILNVNGKITFAIIMCTPDISFLSPENAEMLRLDNSGNRFFKALFRMLNGKDAITDTEAVVRKYDYRFFVTYEEASFCYEFALHTESGYMFISNGGNALGTVRLDPDEVSRLLELTQSCL